jgi:hypothetical protein
MRTPFEIPDGYRALLAPKDTEKAIRLVKESFQTNLALELSGKKGVFRL